MLLLLDAFLSPGGRVPRRWLRGIVYKICTLERILVVSSVMRCNSSLFVFSFSFKLTRYPVFYE